MSKRMYEFECDLGHRSEKFIDEKEMTVVCDHCGISAYRVVSAVRSKLEGWSGSYPSAAMKWERTHELGAKRTTKRDES